MYLTDDGSDIGTKNIVLDGTNGDATFAGTITGATICFPNDPSTPCRSTWPSDVWSTWAGGKIYYTTWNVGIGTGTPQSLLHIYGIDPTMTIESETSGTGVINFTDTDSATILAQIKNDANNSEFYLMNTIAGDMIFWTNNQNRMQITPNGNIGIGTSNPQSLLHVAGRAQFGNNLLTYSTNYDGIVESSGATSLKFNTSWTNTRMTITAAGDVGIGVATPTEKLHVAGNWKFTGSAQVWYEDGRCSTWADAGKIVYMNDYNCVSTSSHYAAFLWCIQTWTSVTIKVIMTWGVYEWSDCFSPPAW